MIKRYTFFFLFELLRLMGEFPLSCSWFLPSFSAVGLWAMYRLYGGHVLFHLQIVNSKYCMAATRILRFSLSSVQVHPSGTSTIVPREPTSENRASRVDIIACIKHSSVIDKHCVPWHHCFAGGIRFLPVSHCSGKQLFFLY